MAFDSDFGSELEKEDNQGGKPPYQKNYNNNNGNKWNNNGGGNGGFNKFKKKPEEPFDPETFTLYRPYYMTGNKDTPDGIIDTMKRLAKELESFNYTLRLGGLVGPDTLLSEAAKKTELYLPWKDFDNKVSKNYFNTPQSLEVAKRFHPSFDTLKPVIHAFLAMNARIVLGSKLDSPVRFVICWSEDGAETGKEKTSRTGNVGHVIAIASNMLIPVFNLGKPDAEQRFKSYLSLND